MSIRHQPMTSKPVFMTDEAIEAALWQMEADPTLDTKSRPGKGIVASEALSFHDMHVLYLREHPKVNPSHYLSNLRTMIKIRSVS